MLIQDTGLMDELSQADGIQIISVLPNQCENYNTQRSLLPMFMNQAVVVNKCTKKSFTLFSIPGYF